MIECPHCSYTNRDGADACYKCKMPFPKARPTPEQLQREENNRKILIVITILAVAALLYGMATTGQLHLDLSSALSGIVPTPTSHATRLASQAPVMCRYFVALDIEREYRNLNANCAALTEYEDLKHLGPIKFTLYGRCQTEHTNSGVISSIGYICTVEYVGDDNWKLVELKYR